MILTQTALLTSLAAGALGAALAPDHVERQNVLGTATINLATPIGTPQHLAAGFLYGIPISQDQIPDHFYTDMGFNYGRAGGGSEPEPARGWAYGASEFTNRFASSISYYTTVRKYGARMQLLIADLWGADGTSQIAMPGDNGDWSSYDDFLVALISAINDNNMAPYLDLEIWNEPDLNDTFWQREQPQYLQMWGRGYYKLRAAFPDNSIIGPCTSSNPYASNTWLQNWLSFIASNGSIPDLYGWHLELGAGSTGDDFVYTIPAWSALLSDYGLEEKPLLCNEYAVQTEQQPGGATWFISRFERYGVQGLRGNWAPNGSYDYFAGLLGKPNADTPLYNATQAGYWNNGEYNVYKYYNLNMTGNRVQTIGSPDNLFDIYATAGTTEDSVKMICGSRLTAGTWDILVTGLDAIGLPSSGTITIQAYQFNYAGGTYGDVPNPVNQGTYPHSYSDNELVFYVSPNTTTSYAFEFVAT